MITLSRRIRILMIAVAVIVLGMWLSLLWQMSGDLSQAPILVLNREDQAEAHGSHLVVNSDISKVIPDDHRQMMNPTRIVSFQLTCTHDTQISVLGTGIQLPSPSGWKSGPEEYRYETWRMRTGIPREVCVERPPTPVRWRAYVHYGKQQKGLSLLKANLQEVWKNRNFSNWGGKAWGGGRWEGSYEISSEEFTE